MKLRYLGRHTQRAKRSRTRSVLLDSVAYYHLAIACTPLPHTAIMSSDYEISDEENEYYDEEDDEMEVDGEEEVLEADDDVEMDVGSDDEAPRPRRKKAKKKQRGKEATEDEDIEDDGA